MLTHSANVVSFTGTIYLLIGTVPSAYHSISDEGWTIKIDILVLEVAFVAVKIHNEFCQK